MVTKTCATCYYGRNKKCTVMKEKHTGCWALADETEARKSAAQIKEYMNDRTGVKPRKRDYKRPVAEKLDKKFVLLYRQGMNDVEISEVLSVSKKSVQAYRHGLGYPTNNRKNRPAPTGTAN